MTELLAQKDNKRCGYCKLILLLIFVMISSACSAESNIISTKNITPTKMKINSPSFEHNESIPAKYTCDAENISVPLAFSDVPEDARSLVLIVDDPDAPMKDAWVHWTMWNIDPKTHEILENSVPAGAVQGVTDFGNNKYGGPCPPSGTHRYFFKLYALNKILDIDPATKKEGLLDAIQGGVVAEAELIGLYQRQ